jgi:protein-S-isoprenylcysteine O-methyltransferase Ste14
MTSKERTRRAVAFDIRLVIALLMGVYGVVLTVLGIGFTTDAEITKSAGVNINLWAGLGMLVVAALFVLWTWLRPLRVPEPDEPAEPGEPTT